MGMISIDRKMLIIELSSYDELSVASNIMTVSEEDYIRIQTKAMEYACSVDADTGRHGMMIAKACAMAAVEIIEGTARPLRRKKRRSESDATRQIKHLLK